MKAHTKHKKLKRHYFDCPINYAFLAPLYTYLMLLALVAKSYLTPGLDVLLARIMFYLASLLGRSPKSVRTATEERFEKVFFEKYRLVICVALERDLLWTKRITYVA